MANRALTLVDGWTLRETIGQGSMGKVKLATKEGAEMAVKIVAKPIEEHGADYMITTRDLSLLPFTPGTDRKSQANQRIVREIAFGLLLKHPSIVPCRHVTMTKEYYYIFFELVKGVQLLDFIISHGKLSEKMASRMMQQIISAVDYCHTYSVVHRDLKIENILVDKQGLIKLVDFGLANLYSSDRLLSTFCGSLYFASPELLNAKKYLGPEIDIWSIGIIFYVLVCGKVPFDDPNLPQLHAKIKSGIVSYPDHLSKDCKDLLSQILVVDPNKRAKMAHIKSHCWFKDRKQFEVYALPRIPEAPLNQDVIDKLQVFGYCSTKDSEDAMDLARHVHQTFDRLVPHPSISREFQIPVASMYVLIEDNIKALQNCSITVNGCPQQERRAGKLNKKQSKAFKLRNKITSKLKKIKGALKISESHSEPNRRNTISIPLGSMDTSKKAEVDHTPVIASLSASNSRESMNASESDFSGLEVLSDSEVHNVKSRLGKRPLRHRSQNTRMLEERRPESISRRHSLASRPPKDASDTIDHNLKQIFFGRIFSVSNTSTKSPTVVRMALLKVLIQISESGMITFQERFGSVYVTSASPFSEQQTVEGMPMPTVPLQMQIRLVQIRWTKLIGIRFKRMNGDAVQYSKLCRLILDSLKL